MKGCDIAWSKPSGSALSGAGFTVASLYVGQDNTGKNMTQAVVDDYHNHGVAVITNFEYGAQQMANGHQQGVFDARLGLSQAQACGMPGDRPIYYSADWAATSSQIQNGIIPYLVGARSVTGPGTVGVYGSYYVVSAVHSYWQATFPGEKIWLCQTAAWSNGNIYNPIDLYQDATTSVVGGITIDNDFLHSADAGQWPGPASKSEDTMLIIRVQGDTSVYGLDGGVLWGISDPASLTSYINAGIQQAEVTPSEIARLQAVQPVAANVNVTITDAQATAIGDAIAAKLPAPLKNITLNGSLS